MQPSPELANYLDAVRQLPKDQGVKVLADLGMKQTEAAPTQTPEQPPAEQTPTPAAQTEETPPPPTATSTTPESQTPPPEQTPPPAATPSASEETPPPAQQPTPQQENQEVPPEDIQSGSATAGASAATPPETPTAAQPSDQPPAAQPAASEAAPAAQPAAPAASQPSTPTGPVNTDENINSFKDAISSAIPTFNDFFRQGRDIAILTDEDDNGDTTAAQSVEAVRNLMREHGIKGAMMPFPVESQQGPNAPKKICYMIKMTKAAPTPATTT